MSTNGADNIFRVMQLGLGHAEAFQATHAKSSAERIGKMAAAFSSLAVHSRSPDVNSAYLVDAWQRAVLTLDVLRQRGNDFIENEANGTPPVLDFAFEVMIDGATLPRPVNYTLVRIVPPAGVVIDPAKRPFMIVDPRAGHGAGIGGFKPESQVGEAFEDGHAVYFVIFRPMPEPGQTLSDVRDAEVNFLHEIQRRHPDSDKAVVIGNCQGGWGSMMLAASAPDKIGPLSINGAPMSYWAGKEGKNPMRYLGGLAGGVVPAMMYSDLGNGVFDGSLLVQNFEAGNPANTHWKKLYSLYANVDTEAGRYLEFERWWGGFFMMNEEEIRWIVENLFVGNRLAQGNAMLGDAKVDLRKITTPIVVFASHGDNITPPSQALNWVADLYRDENEIKARAQRIVYMVHPSIGHLGIFVSAKIAGREHEAITNTMRAIEALPPGLYEMVLENEGGLVRIKFAPRTMTEMLSMDDGRDDEDMFAAVARLSEFGAQAYETLVRPFMRQIVTEQSAKSFFESRPLRRERVMLSDRNPLMKVVKSHAEEVRTARQPVAEDNPWLAWEKLVSEQIEQNLNMFRDWRDAIQELTFHTIYGSPMMRMIGAAGVAERAKSKDADLMALPDVREALARIGTGGEAEGTVRILELMSRARGYTRRSRLEKALELFETEEPFRSMTDLERAHLIHEQALIVQFGGEKAMDSLPQLLDTTDERTKALDFVMRIAGPADTMHPAALELFRKIETMLAHGAVTAVPAPAHAGIADQHATADAPSDADLQFDDASVTPTAPPLQRGADAGSDDLRQIKGIGPKLNQLLNTVGIYRFAQIAAWTPGHIAWINGKLEFAGRVQRERWVQQARVLAASGVVPVAAE